MTAPAAELRPLPPAASLSWEQYAGRACAFCNRPLTTGAVSAGIARGQLDAHNLDTEVYIGPCCAQR